MARNTDFIGFTFNGCHSSEFNIYSVSDGSRYQDNLVPNPIDYTEQVPGGVGQYYFGSDMDIKEFPLSIAYDNLSELQARELRNWLAPDTVGELIFDERPYKTYTAKISTSPSLSFICFDKYNSSTGKKERVYKGEGSINFVCYYPLGVVSGEKKELKYYNNFGNKDEWAVSTGMIENLDTSGVNTGYDHYITLPDNTKGIQLFNPGDKETDFILSFNKPTPMNDIFFTLSNGEQFMLNLRSSDTDVEDYGAVSDAEKRVAAMTGGVITIDTKKNRIMYKYGTGENVTEESIYFALKKGQFFKIPKNKTSTGGYNLVISASSSIVPEKFEEISNEISTDSIKISYDYLYY